MKRYFLLLLIASFALPTIAQRNITEDEWDEMYITKPVVLEFYANWCAPCKQQGSIISRLAQEFPEIDFYKVNIDREKDWFSYETENGAIPLIVFYYVTEERNYVVRKSSVAGFMPYSELRDSCQTILRRYNAMKRKNTIPLKKEMVQSDTIIDIDGVKYTLALDGYVDMGTSVKWAAYNLGANRPEQIGGYYAWGEIETKREYNWYNYKHVIASTLGSVNVSFRRYNIYTDKLNRLLVEDDAVKQHWGGNWRIPTQDDYMALIEKCEWKEFSLKEVNGIIAYSPQKHNAIFFPLTGWMFNGLNDKETVGEYWTMDLPLSPYSGVCDEAYLFYISFDDGSISARDYTGRAVGLPIRPIYDPYGH